MKDSNKTASPGREIISVSVPLPIYNAMEILCSKFSMNRSAMITKAIISYLESMGLKVGDGSCQE